MTQPTRRLVTAALPALAFAAPAHAATRSEFSVRGRTTYSESAMVMSVSADGRSALTLRFCRFPDADLTWLWCHLVRDGEVYAFTANDLGCETPRLVDGANADYRVAGAQAGLSRIGKGAALKTVTLTADLPFHHGRTAPNGPGALQGRMTGRFTPTHFLASQVIKDRDEIYGTFSAEISVDGRRWTHSGLAKFHEQRQTGARFEAPFCYSWLGGEGLAATTLLIPGGASGGWVFGDAEDGLGDMSADPPGADRAVRYDLKSGRSIRGRLESIVRYEIPIYDRRWNGSFVRGVVDGHPVVGVMNDWLTETDIYAAAKTRLR